MYGVTMEDVNTTRASKQQPAGDITSAGRHNPNRGEGRGRGRGRGDALFELVLQHRNRGLDRLVAVVLLLNGRPVRGGRQLASLPRHKVWVQS